jgi:hypothetical protein
VRRWDHTLTPGENRRLLGGQAAPFPALPPHAEAESAGPIAPGETPAANTTDRFTRPGETPVTTPQKPDPPKPTMWDLHIQPFLAANGYIIAGLLMVVAGSSLLTYFTWDKSALVRYLFLPVRLGADTVHGRTVCGAVAGVTGPLI